MPAGLGPIRVPMILNGFTPASLSGLVAWYRADLGVTVATGVSAWTDQSGSGHNLTQGTGANQPTLNATNASYNNQSTITFGASQWLAGAHWASAVSQPFSVFLVGNASNGAGTVFYDDEFSASSLQGSAGTGVAFAGSSLSSGVSVTSPCIFGADFNGGSTKVYKSALTAVATGAAGAGGMTGISAVGNDRTHAFPMSGPLAELCIFSSTVSASDRSKLFSYFGSRYGITVGA